MRNTLLITTLILLTFNAISSENIKKTYGEILPIVRYYDGTTLVEESPMPLKTGNYKDTRSNTWELSVNESIVDKGIVDYKLTWKLIDGDAKDIAVGVQFPFANWSEDNFVFIPSAVYNGNKFEVKKINYPPYWYDKAEWRVDMPTTIPNLPTLGIGENYGKIDIETGNASTPLMAFYSPISKSSWMVLTTQGNSYGNHGLIVEESKNRSNAKFMITSPAVRESSATMGGFVPSGDMPITLKKGDVIDVHFRVYITKTAELKDMFTYFMKIRKDINPTDSREELPYSEARRLVNNLYQQDRWDEEIDLYCLSKPAKGNTWNFIWQLGWCGGGQATLPIMMQGDVERERAMKNIEVIISKSQSESGLFKLFGNGLEFAGFGYGAPLKNNETFMRSQGDWLYMSQRQFNYIESQGATLPAHWKPAIKRLADAFVYIWDKHGQFGQFVDVDTKEICVGGSTSSAIAVGGLALAYQTYSNDKYLETAKSAGRKFHSDYVLKGYTTGGPGEILSSPDSESAFGLFEAYMTMYEVTAEKEWLEYATDLLPICASWTVSYNFKFPENSPMGKIGALSCGTVWASVANKHAAPGICTWSGDSFLKYYRATGNKLALDLIRDIAHGSTQYISRDDQAVGNMPAGGVCERVNTSDWEGKDQVGGNIFSSCSWTEAAAMLTTTQIPSIYIQSDKDLITVFDNIIVEKTADSKLRITNPTKFDAIVTIYEETSTDAKSKNFGYDINNCEKVTVKAGKMVIR